MRSPGASDWALRTSPSLKATERSTPALPTVSTPVSLDWWMKATRSATGKPERSPASRQRGRGAAPPAGGERSASRRSPAVGSRAKRPARSARARRASSVWGATRPWASTSRYRRVIAGPELVLAPASAAPLFLVAQGELQALVRPVGEQVAAAVEEQGGRAGEPG